MNIALFDNNPIKKNGHIYILKDLDANNAKEAEDEDLKDKIVFEHTCEKDIQNNIEAFAILAELFSVNVFFYTDSFADDAQDKINEILLSKGKGLKPILFTKFFRMVDLT